MMLGHDRDVSGLECCLSHSIHVQLQPPLLHTCVHRHDTNMATMLYIPCNIVISFYICIITNILYININYTIMCASLHIIESEFYISCFNTLHVLVNPTQDASDYAPSI